MVFILFSVLYFVNTLYIIPWLAPFFGRVALPHSGTLRPRTSITWLLNRHYATPELHAQLTDAAQQMSLTYPGSGITYLDASFPFLTGFPLFPHLSHDDGRKADLAFYYLEASSGVHSEVGPSWLGYGLYEAPRPDETNYSEECARKGFWQYGQLEYFVPKWHQKDFELDVWRTRALLSYLATRENTAKIFIEPHLKERWNLQQFDKIRFHGCQAVRHDDHIHLQTR